ncbi:MAG: AEC family transporter [bacterium]|nr:AEC family transporter [bacterium]
MHVLDVVLPIFLVIGLGQVLRRAGFFDDKVAAAVSRLVFYVAAPALLARATAAESLTETFNLPVLAVVMAATVLVGGATYAACFGSSRTRRGVIAQATFRANQVFVGLPVVIYAFGEESVNQVAVLVSLMVIVYNFQGVVVLVLPQQDRTVRSTALLARTAARVLRNPLIIACVAGILFSLTGLTLPVALDRTLALVGRTAAPLALLAVGAGMDVRRLRADLRTAALVALVKTIVYPALIYAGLRALGFAGADLQLPVMIMAAPTAVVSYVMARELDGDADLAGAIIVGSTLLSMVTITGWLVILG